jgi:GNAT superfamily N-acetyltransferase
MMNDEFLDGDVDGDRRTEWSKRLASPAANQLVLVADDGTVRGFVCAYGDDDARWGTLVDNLHVRYDARKLGIGARLMREAASWAIERYPGRGMYLWVMQKNVNAQQFYERTGGVNVEAQVHEDVGRGAAHSFRIAWDDPRVLLAPTKGAAK